MCSLTTGNKNPNSTSGKIQRLLGLKAGAFSHMARTLVLTSIVFIYTHKYTPYTNTHTHACVLTYEDFQVEDWLAVIQAQCNHGVQ